MTCAEDKWLFSDVYPEIRPSTSYLVILSNFQSVRKGRTGQTHGSNRHAFVRFICFPTITLAIEEREQKKNDIHKSHLAR